MNLALHLTYCAVAGGTVVALVCGAWFLYDLARGRWAR